MSRNRSPFDHGCHYAGRCWSGSHRRTQYNREASDSGPILKGTFRDHRVTGAPNEIFAWLAYIRIVCVNLNLKEFRIRPPVQLQFSFDFQ